MKTFKLRRKVFVLKEHELYRQKDEIFNSFHRSTKWEMNETLIVLCSFMRLRLYRKKRIQIEIVSVNWHFTNSQSLQSQKYEETKWCETVWK